jgi:hypothetical protein
MQGINCIIGVLHTVVRMSDEVVDRENSVDTLLNQLRYIPAALES